MLIELFLVLWRVMQKDTYNFASDQAKRIGYFIRLEDILVNGRTDDFSTIMSYIVAMNNRSFPLFDPGFFGGHSIKLLHAINNTLINYLPYKNEGYDIQMVQSYAKLLKGIWKSCSGDIVKASASLFNESILVALEDAGFDVSTLKRIVQLTLNEGFAFSQKSMIELFGYFNEHLFELLNKEINQNKKQNIQAITFEMVQELVNATTVYPRMISKFGDILEKLLTPIVELLSDPDLTSRIKAVADGITPEMIEEDSGLGTMKSILNDLSSGSLNISEYTHSNNFYYFNSKFYSALGKKGAFVDIISSIFSYPLDPYFALFANETHSSEEINKIKTAYGKLLKPVFFYAYKMGLGKTEDIEIPINMPITNIIDLLAIENFTGKIAQKNNILFWNHFSNIMASLKSFAPPFYNLLRPIFLTLRDITNEMSNDNATILSIVNAVNPNWGKALQFICSMNRDYTFNFPTDLFSVNEMMADFWKSLDIYPLPSFFSYSDFSKYIDEKFESTYQSAVYKFFDSLKGGFITENMDLVNSIKVLFADYSEMSPTAVYECIDKLVRKAFPRGYFKRFSNDLMAISQLFSTKSGYINDVFKKVFRNDFIQIVSDLSTVVEMFNTNNVFNLSKANQLISDSLTGARHMKDSWLLYEQENHKLDSDLACSAETNENNNQFWTLSKNTIIIIISVSAAVALIITALITFFAIRRRKQKGKEINEDLI